MWPGGHSEKNLNRRLQQFPALNSQLTPDIAYMLSNQLPGLATLLALKLRAPAFPTSSFWFNKSSC